jgi:hypothetical protein
MKRFLNGFFAWYERHHTLNTVVTSVLFLWQLTHLYWLSTHVVAQRLLGHSLFNPSRVWEIILIIADYGEIPALLSASLLYIYTMRREGHVLKNLGYLLLINSQWLHLFWITDEFVIDTFTGHVTSTILPAWLAWIAIGIDYLELPVMYDTIKKSGAAMLRSKPQPTQPSV